MSRIDLHDSVMDLIMKLGEGNPGGLTVLMRMLKETKEWDDNPMGVLGYWLMLDAKEIYGSKIWILYKDLCQESLRKTLLAIRSIQLGDPQGIVEKVNLISAGKYPERLNHAEILADVCKTLKWDESKWKED